MAKAKQIRLKRELGLFEATACGVAVIIGAGIYALIGKAAGIAGMGVWVSFLIAAIVAALTGLSFAELSSRFPKSGAEYVYSREAFGKYPGFIVGWLVVIGGIFGGATVALGFAGYFASFISLPLELIAIALIAMLSVVNFFGIKQSVWTAIILTAVEVLGLIIVIAIGLPHFGSVNYFNVQNWGGVFSAAALIFFAYIGFEEITKLSEETKNAKKVIPKALIIAVAFTTIMYILTAISAISVLSPAELYSSTTPLADVAAKGLGSYASNFMVIIALFSTASTVLLFLLATSRMIYGMTNSHKGLIGRFLSKIHPTRRTPWAAVLAITVLTMIMVFAGNIEVAASLTNFAVFVTFAVINLSLIRIRFKHHEPATMFKVPLNIGKFPVLAFLGFLTCVFLLINLSIDILVYGVLVMVVGLVLYRVFEKSA